MNKVLKIVATRSFEDAVKQLKKKHEKNALNELHDTIISLANFEVTKQKSNHPLKNAQGHKDLHLNGGKLVLIYRYDDDTLYISLRLQDVVNHNKLASYDSSKYNAPAKEYDTESIVSSTSFDKWYDSLPEEEQWEVDSMADSMAVPFYDEATDAELAQLKDAYESSKTSVQGANEVRMNDGTASNYQSFMTWYNSLNSYQKLGVDDYAEIHDYPAYEECTFGMLSNIMREFEVEEEEYDEWAAPRGVYHVAAFGNDYDELQTSADFKDPKQAITKWAELEQKWPMNVMITGFQEEEENLRKYVTEHEGWFRALAEKFNIPYKTDYIIEECAKPVRPWTGKYANKYPDQCHPFGLG